MTELVAEVGLQGAVLSIIAAIAILGVAIALYIGIGIIIAYLVRQLGDRDEKGAVKDFREEEWEAFIRVAIVFGWGLVLLSLPVLLPIVILIWVCKKAAENMETSEKIVQ